MTLPNPLEHAALADLAVLHDDRGFSPIDRQRTLYKSLLSGPCPPDDQYSGADRLTLPGLEPTNGYPDANRLPETDTWRRNHG